MGELNSWGCSLDVLGLAWASVRQSPTSKYSVTRDFVGLALLLGEPANQWGRPDQKGATLSSGTASWNALSTPVLWDGQNGPAHRPSGQHCTAHVLGIACKLCLGEGAEVAHLTQGP